MSFFSFLENASRRMDLGVISEQGQVEIRRKESAFAEDVNMPPVDAPARLHGQSWS